MKLHKNLKKKIKVLDKGYIKLVNYMGTEESIIEAARMSTGKGFLGWEPNSKVPGHKGDEKLLTYLYTHGHTSPFEQCELVIEMQAPIFTLRQLMRYRTMQPNEFSGRYAVMPHIFYVPEMSRVCKQNTVNKQSSGASFEEEEQLEFINDLKANNEAHIAFYDKWQKSGLANETNRLSTPLNQYSKVRMKGNLRNWLHLCNQRCKSDTQWETQQYANIIAHQYIKTLWPRTHKLWLENTHHSVTFSASEIQLLISYLKGNGKDLPSALQNKIGLK